MAAQWQHYRTNVNGNEALFSVNLSYVDEQRMDASTVVQFELPFEAESDGLPSESNFKRFIRDLIKVTSLINSLEDVSYVGYWLCKGVAQVYFYCTYEDKSELVAILEHANCQKIKAQLDPTWDIYFDFLIPSPLEIKMTATEEMLSILRQHGEELDKAYKIDHRFYFYQEQDMQEFLEYVAEQDKDFLSLQHSNMPVPVRENENAYLVKVEQEVNLEENIIFDTVEFFEQTSQEFQGRYLGWRPQNSVMDEKYLN